MSVADWWTVGIGLPVAGLLWLAGTIVKRKLRQTEAELRELGGDAEGEQG